MILLSFAAAVATAGAGAARATVVADVPLAVMAEEAIAVVRGRVERVGARVVVDGAGHRVETVVRLRVRAWWKGRPTDDVLLLVEPGGHTPVTRTVTHGAPRYVVGEEVVVFLEEGPGGVLHTYGLALGRFVVRRDGRGVAWATRDLSDVALARDVGGRATLVEGTAAEALPLADLEALVRDRARLPGAAGGALR